MSRYEVGESRERRGGTRDARRHAILESEMARDTVEIQHQMEYLSI